MKATDDKTRRAFQFGKLIGILQTAKVIGSKAVDPIIIRRLRVEAASKIRKRASLVGKVRRGRSNDLPQRYGLALQNRILKRRQQKQARDIEFEDSLKRFRMMLASFSREKRDLLPPALNEVEDTRFHLETSSPMELSVLQERVRHALGFQSVEKMQKAGVTIQVHSRNASRRVFNITFPLRLPKPALSSSQMASLLRSATGAVRLTSAPVADLAKFRQRIQAYTDVKRRHGYSLARESKEARCCCCVCESEAPANEYAEGSSVHPTWPSIPDDTEWHLKQMRVKQAWALEPPPGGKSQGEGILIAHPDTGWREHEEYNQSQLRFDLARNVLEARDGKEATRHGTLTIPPGLFQTHGTGTGGVMISAEARGQTHVGDVPFDKMIATSSDVQLTGIAPKATLAPIRCADGVILRMDPNIHKAIEHAIDIKAHVISISLGGILDADFERLIDQAVFDHNIIVVASAGQFVNWGDNSLVEPASFTNVIAVTGSTPAGIPWDGSCRGPKAAASAPARGVWFPNFFLDGTPGIYWGEGTSFSAAEVAAVAALWLAYWGRDRLLARYPNVPLAHVFRQLLRQTAWRPNNWSNLYGAGIVDVYALLKEPLAEPAEIVPPSDTDEFNFLDSFSDLLDLGGALAGQVWDAVAGAGGAIGDFFGEMLNLSILGESQALVGAIADGAADNIKAWADEQAVMLSGMVDDSLSAAGEAWNEIVAGGEEAVDAAGDIMEAGGDMMEDLGDAAAETWDQASDFVASLF